MVAAFLIACNLLVASNDTLTPADSVRLKRPKLAPAFNLDFRDSFLERQHVNVWGVNAGIQFGIKRHQITLGYYWINYATYLRLIDWRRAASRRINLDYYTRSDMWFMSLLYWFNITNNQKWQVSLPVELGGGVANAIPLNLREETPRDRNRKDFFVPLQAGAYAQWRATRWVGLSAQVGYRLSVFQTAIDQNFNGTYYSIGITIYPTIAIDLWRWIRKGDRISPIHPPQPRK
ncbi:hypothetical protein IC229_21670 [Spirosoma sp. BT702]|uniref:DUF3575 domain-containing protein n=1 Tax=Spirosoma profusum TaxID=2771354 RepID=A0A926XYN1_9BACT|nr:hypothetical protein [Spirosoma profusum]MBD2703269.1 hypothetical protein [Spirosoma profusum]